MIERESILPLTVGALLALLIHLLALPGAVVVWSIRQGDSTYANAVLKPDQVLPAATIPADPPNLTTQSAHVPPPGASDNNRAPLSKPTATKPTTTRPTPAMPQARTAKKVLTEDEPELDPTKPQVRLGKDDADEVYRVGWISYDDFQQLIAPRSTTEQPALQARMNPVPGAPLRGDPTVASSAAQTASPVAPASTGRPSLASASVKPGEPLVSASPAKPIPPAGPQPSVQDPAETATDLARKTEQIAISAKPIGPTAEQVATARTSTASPPSIGPTPNPEMDPSGITPSKAALSKANDASSTPGALDSNPSLAMTSGAITELASAGTSTLSLTPSSGTHRTIAPVPAKPVEAAEPVKAPNQATPESLPSTLAESQLYPSAALVPDLRMVVRRDAASTGTSDAQGPAGTSAAGGTDETTRPSSAPRADKESSPVSLTDHPINVQLQPGAVLVGRGVEIKTAMPRLSTVARFVIPHNARVQLKFDRSGEVIHASFIKSTGFETWDGPILASLFQWRATGKIFAQHPGPFELEINLIFIRE